MKTNQAKWERIVRIITGLAALAGGYAAPSQPEYLGAGLMVMGIALTATGLLAYCPAWHLLGISTKRGQ